MKTNSIRSLLRASTHVAFTLILAAPAVCQFPGDVYFVNPSLSVPQGGTAEFDLQTFIGTASLGAAQIDIEYKDAELAVTNVVAQPGFADLFEVVISPGKLTLVGLNGHSLTEPVGTVDLAKVSVKPKVAAGKRVTLTIRVQRMLTAASDQISRTKGFTGTLLVTAPNPPELSMGIKLSSRVVFDWRDLGFQTPLSPFGRNVIHYEPAWIGGRCVAAPVLLCVIDPRAYREVGEPRPKAEKPLPRETAEKGKARGVRARSTR